MRQIVEWDEDKFSLATEGFVKTTTHVGDIVGVVGRFCTKLVVAEADGRITKIPLKSVKQFVNFKYTQEEVNSWEESGIKKVTKIEPRKERKTEK